MKLCAPSSISLSISKEENALPNNYDSECLRLQGTYWNLFQETRSYNQQLVAVWKAYYKHIPSNNTTYLVIWFPLSPNFAHFTKLIMWTWLILQPFSIQTGVYVARAFSCTNASLIFLLVFLINLVIFQKIFIPMLQTRIYKYNWKIYSEGWGVNGCFDESKLQNQAPGS